MLAFPTIIDQKSDKLPSRDKELHDIRSDSTDELHVCYLLYYVQGFDCSSPQSVTDVQNGCSLKNLQTKENTI